MLLNKQEQFTPLTDVNLLNSLLPVANFGGFDKGEQEQKAQVLLIRCTNGNTAPVFWLLTTFVVGLLPDFFLASA